MENAQRTWPLGHIWETKTAFAADLGDPAPTVASWFAEGRRVPPARYSQIIAAAARRGWELTWMDLEGLAQGAWPDGKLLPKPSEDAA